MSRKEVAEYLGVSLRTVDNLIQQEIRVQITKIQREIDLKQYLPKSDLTFDELITQYFEDYKKYRVKPQTMSGYRLRYKNVFKPFIGDVPVQKITEDMPETVEEVEWADWVK